MAIGNRVSLTGQSSETKPAQSVRSIDFVLSKPKYSFGDLILPATTASRIEKALAFRKHHELVFNHWGLKDTHRHSSRVCMNFYGPPGTGKTMAAHAVADYLEKSLLIVNYADIESKYVGDTPKNLVAAFETAEKSDAIIFFDEADALLSKRVTNMTNSTDTSVNQTRSVLLNILNDYGKTILFATNFIENFDPAFMRRILSHVKFELPDSTCRKRLFDMYIPQKMPHAIDVNSLAIRFENMSGSDISNAVMLAAFSAAERSSRIVEMNDIIDAINSILESKKANGGNIVIEKREVTKSYVEESLGVLL